MTEALFYQESDGHCPVFEFLSVQPPLVRAHALTKKGKIPHADLERAIARQARFKSDPRRHTK